MVSTTQPLELLHLDLFGPEAYKSIGGKQYCFVIIDDYSRYSWVLFLRTKDCAFEEFEKLIKLLENKLKTKLIAPRTPQQNGVVERKNRSLQETRTLLQESKLPRSFWVEAVNTACYVFNRVIIRPILNKTPYQLLRNKTPNIGYFKVFGSKCFVLKKIDRDGKFDAKSFEAIFLGYSSTSRSYRYYNLDKRIVEKSIDIVFIEPNNDLPRDEEDDAGTNPYSQPHPSEKKSDEASTPASKLAKTPSPQTVTPSQQAGTSSQPTRITLQQAGSSSQQGGTESQQVGLSSTVQNLSDMLSKINLDGSYVPKETKKQYIYDGQQPSPTKWILASHEEISQQNLPKATRTVKNHPPELVIGNISERIKTRKGKANFCAYAAFLAQEEPKSIKESLEDENWIMAMQEELNQFERCDVWELVKRPENASVIGRTSLMKKNALGLCMLQKDQEMDVKSVFINGLLEEEVYVKQPPGFEHEQYLDYVYKLKKALYGLKQAPRSWYKRLTSRPDIMYSVSVCARFQDNPKESHLKVIKRIFCYLSGTINLGLFYPISNTFDHVGYSDADYAGSQTDRKSTSGVCNFLGSSLVCWQSKKQTSVALSTTEGEYLAAGSCCSQILWMMQTLKDFGIKCDKVPIYCDNTSTINISENPVLHSRTKHIDVRHHLLRDNVAKGKINLVYVPKEYQLADIFTKHLPEERFLIIRRELGRKFDVSGLILSNMLDCLHKKNWALPYGLPLTHIFRHFGLKLDAKDKVETSNFFDAISLTQSSLQVTAEGALEKISLPPPVQASISSHPASSTAEPGVSQMLLDLKLLYSEMKTDMARISTEVVELRVVNNEIKRLNQDMMSRFDGIRTAVSKAANLTICSTAPVDGSVTDTVQDALVDTDGHHNDDHDTSLFGDKGGD
ncbi:hypothetical protein AgCh_037733 [Apium graveolens]